MIPTLEDIIRGLFSGDYEPATNKDSLTVAGGQQGEARPARDLPPLPIPWKQVPDADGVLVDVFRTFQMRDFGRAALATQAAPEAQSEQGERDTLRALLREARTLHLPIALASWNEEPQYAHRVEEVLTLIARIDAALADGGAK